jgi:hypothetical protein
MVLSHVGCLACIEVQLHFGSFHELVAKQDVIWMVRRIEDECLNLFEMAGEGEL